MVDFNNETTIATPSKDIMRVYLIENKAYTEDNWRRFRTKDFEGLEASLSIVRACLEQWYIIIEPIINRHWDSKEIPKDKIEYYIEKGKKKDLFKLIITFNRLLDKIKLTQLDTRETPKRTIEASNLAKNR